MTIIEQIKAEIERQITEHKVWSSFYHSRGKHSDFEKGTIFALNRMLHFIDNLCEEKSARQRLAEWSKTPEGRESYEKVASEMRKQIVPNDLEEAAKKHSCYDEDCEGAWYEPIVRNAFIAGANWQKEQYHFFNEAWADKMQYQLDRNYENGKQAMKEQMMKEAVEGTVIIAGNDGYSPHADVKLPNTPYFHLGRKVKVIIVREDEK